MEWLLAGVIVVLATIIIVLSIKIYALRRSVYEITTAFEKHLTEDTNTLIDVPIRDKTMIYLAVSINAQLKLLRKQRHRYINGDRELKEAITNISHDLRTPLTAICGYLDLLNDIEQSETTKRYIDQITNRCETLKQLTEELFRYSVVCSVSQLAFEKINLCRVLEESLLSFYGEMKKSNISPSIQIPTKPVWRNLDERAVCRVFNNIIGNAVKYSDGDFFVTLSEDGILTFTNTARELSVVDVEKLFDRFFTVNSARKTTGLGLAIAKTLVEQMNGNITAKYIDKKLSIIIDFRN